MPYLWHSSARRSPSALISSRVTRVAPSADLRNILRRTQSGTRMHWCDLTMYELADRTSEADLAADAARGVDVRVLLDQHLEKSRNASACNYLNAHHVRVGWAPAGTTYHQKTLTVDNATS